MPRVVRCGLIQTHCEWSPEKFSLAQIKQKMMAKHEKLIADAAKKKVQICFSRPLRSTLCYE